MTETATRSSGLDEKNEIMMIIYGFGIIKLMIHLYGLEGYGLHADELYYIELGQHLRWGFLDISPFVSWIAALSEYLLGSSTTAFRILPCIFAASTVILTGQITRLMGGKRLAIIIACSSIICSPAFLATSYLLQPAIFDQFFWTLLAYFILSYSRNAKTLYLYLCALALGLGMLNKYSILLLVGSLACAWIIVANRPITLKPKKLIGPFVLFLLIISPNLLWQWDHGFPVFNYTLKVGKGAFHIEIWDYLLQLILFHGASLAVWSAGFLYLLLDRKHQGYGRIWPIAFILIIIFLAVLKGKLYYGLGIFPIFFASGGLCWSLMLERLAVPFRLLFISSLYLFAILSLPIVIPILPMNLCRAYITEMVKLTGFSRPLRYEDGTTGGIPQFFADMSDWNMLDQKVRRAIRSPYLPDQSPVIILTNNYAVAGALKHFAGNEPIRVISVHNSFLMDSPETLNVSTIIYLSREKPKEMMELAREVIVLDSLETENTHLSGLYIYQLSYPSDRFRLKYTRDRESFYQRSALQRPDRKNVVILKELLATPRTVRNLGSGLSRSCFILPKPKPLAFILKRNQIPFYKIYH